MTSRSDNVVALFAHPRPSRLPLACEQAALPTPFERVNGVIAYWDALRAGQTTPSRSAIDPSALGQALSNIFLAEVVAPGQARIRLSGQVLSDLLGMEPRGMPLSVLFAMSARDEVAMALRQVMTGARVRLPIRAETGFGKPGMDGEIALMPLLDTTGRPSRVLGVVETIGQIGRAPRRFTLRVSPRPMAGVPPFSVIEGRRT
ncbi:MAG: PAS domain-containing protein [Paracoccaceae bacterium]